MKAGWKETTLGRVCEVRGGGTPSTDVSRYWQGDIPWVSPKDMKSRVVTDSIDHISLEAIQNSAASLIPEGAVLVVVRSGILARTIPIAIAGRSLAINQDIKAICPSEMIGSRFLCYLLEGLEDVLLGMVTRGATVHRLTTDIIREMRVCLPPLLEQQRIVGILDEAFEGIATAAANAEKNLQNARALFDSHLNEVFTRGGEGWVVLRLSDLCNIRHGFAFKSEFFANSGDYVMLTPGNFYETGGYRDRGDKQKYYAGPIPSGYMLDRGDLLVAMTEQAAGLLGSAILVPETNKFLHNQRLGLVLKKPGVHWTNELLFRIFNTRSVRTQIHESASGVKVRHTSPGKIGEVEISLPPPSEQATLVDKCNELEEESGRLESIYQLKLAALEALKKSLLHQAFSGNL